MQYGINQPNLSRPCPPIDVELVRSAVILAHPVAALCLIWAFYRQRAWRKESPSLSGAERKSAVEHHESMGDRIAMATLAIVVLAFASNAVRGVIDHDDPTRLLIPGHFHGWSGIIGVSLMFFLWRLGRKTKEAKDSGDSFSRTKELHGQLSDIMGILLGIHAFLGFLYLLTIF